MPTEAEWEAACCGVAEGDGLAPHKGRDMPWGDAPLGPRRKGVVVRLGPRSVQRKALGSVLVLDSAWAGVQSSM